MYIFGKDITIRESDSSTITDILHGYHIPPPITPSTILDLGCNIGLTILNYQTLWPNATIVGVELDDENVRLARQNTNATIIHAAVAAENGIRYYDPTVAPFAFRLGTGNRQVQTVTLQSLVDMCGGFADFVKMDVEGAEFEILTKDADLTRIGSILVEIHNQSKVDEIQTILQDHGFQASKHLIHWSSVWATKCQR